LYDLRAGAGVTVGETARRMRKAHSLISVIEGRGTSNVDTLRAFALALRLPLDAVIAANEESRRLGRPVLPPGPRPSKKVLPVDNLPAQNA